MSTTTPTVGVWLEGDGALDLEAFATACGLDPAWVQRLVEEGLLQPASDPQGWRFGGPALARARRIRRLQRDFEASLQSVAVMLELLDEIERLRAQIRRAG